MARMGHSSTRAAMVYLHSTDERQRTLADTVDKAARTELRKAKNKPRTAKKPGGAAGQSGTDVARTGNEPRKDHLRKPRFAL
jgi:hypothetical protein